MNRSNPGLLALVALCLSSSSVAVAESCYFEWHCSSGQRQAGLCGSASGSGTERFASRSACIAKRNEVDERTRGGFSMSPCQCTGSASPASSGPDYQQPSGPSQADRQQWLRARQEEEVRQQEAARAREAARQREFEADRQALISDLSNTSLTGTATSLNRTRAASIHQLTCSVSKAQHAATSYESGDYREAYRFSRASVGEAATTGDCAVGSTSIPPVPAPVAEVSSPKALRFEELHQEITATVQILSTAALDVERAQQKTHRVEKQMERQRTLVARLEQAPASSERDEGLEKANDLLAKAKALLAESRSVEAAADEKLKALSSEEAYLSELEKELATALVEEEDGTDD